MPHRTGFPDREPVLPPLALADMIAGLYGAIAVRDGAAVRGEQGISPGQVIDLSLLEPIVSVLGRRQRSTAVTGKVKERTGSASNTRRRATSTGVATASMSRCRARRRRWRGVCSR